MDGKEAESKKPTVFQSRKQKKVGKEVKEMAKPLLDIHCKTESFCEYPTVLKVAMDDGTIQTYVLENKTGYQFENVMKCLKRMKVGYQYKEPRQRRNRIHQGKR